MYRNTVILFCTLLLCLTACQVDPVDYPAAYPVITYNAGDYEHSFDSLVSELGYRKELPAGFELQTLLALKHYPELTNTRINFIVKEAFIPLASRPSLISLLRQRDKRTYRVIISDQSLPQMDAILLKNLPFNAQVAIIGHELAHAVEYETMNSHQLSAVGLLYFIGSFRASMEKGTDKRTIEHGLGWQLLEYAEYVRKVSGSDDRQTDFMDKFYMNPQEIRTLIDQSELYQKDFQ
ncbi:MAG: hypothetical protein V3V53_14845 [Bacteroidales bacterium]